MTLTVTVQVMGQQMPSRGSGYGQAAALQAPAMTGAAPPQPPAAPAPTGPPPTVNVSNVDVSKVGQGWGCCRLSTSPMWDVSKGGQGLGCCCWSLPDDGDCWNGQAC